MPRSLALPPLIRILSRRKSWMPVCDLQNATDDWMADDSMFAEPPAAIVTFSAWPEANLPRLSGSRSKRSRFRLSALRALTLKAAVMASSSTRPPPDRLRANNRSTPFTNAMSMVSWPMLARHTTVSSSTGPARR